jgi:peptidoglycan-associated lipoprotein
MRSTAFLITITGVALAAACHSAPPKEVPAPQPTEAETALHRHVMDSLAMASKFTADSIENARQLALAASARADSIEQARLAAETAAREVARQDSTLRGELAVMVHFDVAKSKLTTDDQSALDRKVAILNANPDVRLRITGATDDRGSDRYNVALGTRRANAVKQYLIEKGIDVARLDVISSGETSPIDSGTGETAWAQNRRAEFAIVSGDTPLAMK